MTTPPGRPRRPDSDRSADRGPRQRLAQQARPPARSGPRRPPSARRTAYDLLHEVGGGDAYANLVLPRLLREADLSDRDAGFATELAYGTLRWRGLYDPVLAACVDRPLDKLDPRLLDVLRMGCHQLLGLGTPVHAAVGESVDLARDVLGDGASRLANAVLRKVAAADRAAWISRVAPAWEADPAGHLAVAWSHPLWIVRALREALGTTWEETALVLEADNAPARPVLAARPGLLTHEELLAMPGVEPGRWSPYAGVLATGRPDRIAAVRDGRVSVQDEGSQLVALAVAAAPMAGPDERWVDLCAGPGGKAALLACVAVERGAHLTAVEPMEHRARLVERTLQRIPGRPTVVVGDGRTVDLGRPDRILVDAPCTGLGALRRRPEARWRRTPADIGQLGLLQRGLLSAALDAVRPGGIVGYVTCSPHLAETSQVVADVLRDRPGVRILDARPVLAQVCGREVPDLGEGPTVRLWPHRQGTDAMFLALLTRT